MAASDDLPRLYQDVILRHNRAPSHFGDLVDATHHHEGFSRLCGETLTIKLVVDAADRISSIRFSGDVSAVAMASASMMSQRVEEQTRERVIAMCQQVQAFLSDPDGSVASWIESDPSLHSLKALLGHRSRLAAAALPWQTCEKALLADRAACPP